MTDFLDRLEADLRVAAENRGRRRPQRPGRALKALAFAAVLALIVVGIVRLVGRDAEVHPARPTPTPTPSAIAFFLDEGDIVAATAGVRGALNLLTAHLDWSADTGPATVPNTADPSLGTVVLFREGDERLARAVAGDAGIDRVEVLTPELEQQLNFDLGTARVVVVYGEDAAQSALDDCQAAGMAADGELLLCHEGDVTVFLVDGEPLDIEPLGNVGDWEWAAASPDGRTILAQWVGVCQMPQAVLIPATGGRLQALTDDASRAMGWTTDGRAIIYRFVGAECDLGDEAALRLVRTNGTPDTLGRLGPPSLSRSVEARDAEEILGAP